MKPDKLTEMCLSETYNEIFIGIRQSDKFPIQSGVKQGGALLPISFIFAREYTIKKILGIKPGWTEFEWTTSAVGLC